MTDSSKQAEAAALKLRGNNALSAGQPQEALKMYTQALQLQPDNAAFYCNRSAAYCQLGKFQKGLEDAEQAVRFKPRWVKGYVRKGQALSALNRQEEALYAYFDGLAIDPRSELLKNAIREAKSKLGGPGSCDLPVINPFADDDVWRKLQANPESREWLKDPEFRSKVEKLRKDNRDLGTLIQEDVRIMSSLGILLDVDLQLPNPNQMDDEPSDAQASPAPETAPSPKPAPAATSTSTSSPAPGPAKPAAAAAAAAAATVSVGREKEQQALKEKEKGNAAYKSKEFETAIQHYDKACELDPTNITFRTNKAAVYFEQGQYDRSIEECKKAIEIGRENRQDYKLIAKAFARVGNSHYKKEEYKEALAAYNSSLSEHRDQEIVRKVLQLQKTMKEMERLAYIDTDKSLEEKQQGNQCFQKGDYPAAIKHYGEAIKRNPDDAKLFSNRAACFTKLLEFSMALKDCEECIRLDPKFVKGYLRKGGTLLALKETAKAADAYQKALEVDPNCQEAMDGYRRAAMQDNDPESVKKRAMQNPEVQQILGDPAMQLILQQMQKDPKAIHEHLQNPEVAKKIEKLMEAGLIAFR